MQKRVFVVGLLMLIWLMPAGGCAAPSDRYSFRSTGQQPTSVSIVRSYDHEVLWHKDVPVGHQLDVKFVRGSSARSSRWGELSHERVEWSLYEVRNPAIDGRAAIYLTQRGELDLPNVPTLLLVDSRPVGSTAPPPADPVVELQPLASLAPNTPTLLAVDLRGNIYWMQQTGRSAQVYMLGSDGTPRAIALSDELVLSALGTARGEGRFHSLAAGPDGALYFYFAGGAGQRVVACIGRFDPLTGLIDVLADTPRLQQLTGMSQSIYLAQGSIVANQRYLWLWLRHSDASRMLRLDFSQLTGPLRWVEPFQNATINGEPLPLSGATARAELTRGPGHSLLLLDRGRGALWQIDPDGRARQALRLWGLPRETSLPSFHPDGRIALFAADAPPLASPDPAQAGALSARFPALLLIPPQAPRRMQIIDAARIRSPSDHPPRQMRLQQLAPLPDQPAWIGYDRATGELLRITLP